MVSPVVQREAQPLLCAVFVIGLTTGWPLTYRVIWLPLTSTPSA